MFGATASTPDKEGFSKSNALVQSILILSRCIFINLIGVFLFVSFSVKIFCMHTYTPFPQYLSVALDNVSAKTNRETTPFPISDFGVDGCDSASCL